MRIVTMNRFSRSKCCITASQWRGFWAKLWKRRNGARRASHAEYEPLPAILTIEDAIAASSFHSAPLRLARGDASAIESSALRFEGELEIGGQEHFYLETQCAIARLDESGGVAAILRRSIPRRRRK